MNAVLLAFVLAAHSLQMGSIRTASVLSSADSAFDGVINRMTQALNDFNTFVDSATKRASDAVSTEVKKPFDAVYDRVAQAAGVTNNQCVESQKKQADSDIDSLNLAGMHCITDIATDISNNTLDIVNAIAATKNAAASAATALQTCYTRGAMGVGSCVAKETTAATVEAAQQDVKAGIAIAKLATLRERIPANLSSCATQQAATAALKAAKILSELSKC